MTRPTDLPDLLVRWFDSTDAAVSIADATRPGLPLLHVNAAFERLTGYRAAEVVGRDAGFVPDAGPDAEATQGSAQEAAEEVRDALREGRPARVRLLDHRADGTPYRAELHLSPVHDAAGTLTWIVAVQRDVTAEEDAQRAAVEAATRDSVTGLVSRSVLIAGLERELARAVRRGTGVAVLFVDLDDFKEVNDTHGHVVGDDYLVHVATCLRGRLRTEDLVARVGGDEFVGVLTDLPDDGGQAVRDVVADLDRAIRGPFTVDGVEHRTSASIGTATFPADGTTVRELFSRSDTDMYRHKARSDRRPGGPRREPER